jgi:hypothetical protein
MFLLKVRPLRRKQPKRNRQRRKGSGSKFSLRRL